MTIPQDDARRWPTSPADLANTQLCPACFATLTAMTCAHCGLVVSDPRAMQLLVFGQQILQAEAARQRVIADIRAAHAVAAAPVVTAAAGVAAPVAERVTPQPLVRVSVTATHDEDERWVEPVTSPITAGPRAVVPASVNGTPAIPHAAPVTPARPRRLTVPVLLLIVGVSLVGVAAIFFLTLAWFVAGIAVRALIIGTITLATILTASLLRRRDLTATAEGVGALGVILVALDAWAVRANDLFGAGALDPALYAGVAAIGVAVVSRLWAVLSRLRGPDLAALVALPAGIGLIIGGALDLPALDAVAAGLLGASAGALAYALPAPFSAARARTDSFPERLTLAVIGLGTLLIGAVVAMFASLEFVIPPLWTAPLVIALGVAHTLALRPRAGEEPLPQTPLLRGLAASIAVATAGLLGWQLAWRIDEPLFAQLVAPVLAVLTAVVIDRLRSGRTVLRAPAITAAVIAGASVLVAVSTNLAGIGADLVMGWAAWITDPLTPLADSSAEAWPATIAGILLSALLFAAPTLSRPGLRDARAIAATALLLAGTARLGIPALTVGVAIVAVAFGLWALARRPSSIGWSAAITLAGTVAYVAGTAMPWLWLVAVLVTIATPIALALISKPAGEGRVWLAVVPVAIATLSAFIAPAAIASLIGAQTGEVSAALVLVQWVALVTLAAAVALRLGDVTRTALSIAGYALVALSLLQFAVRALPFGFGAVAGAGEPGAVVGALGEPAFSIPRTLALLIALVVIAVGRSRVRSATALGAAVLTPIVAASAVFAILDVAGQSDAAWAGLPTIGAATAVVWVGALVGRRQPRPRLAADIGAALTIFSIAWRVPGEYSWAGVALIAAAFVAASLTRGWAGVLPAGEGVPSTSTLGVALGAAPRRILAWPALLFATLALWSGLAEGDVSVQHIEAYVVAPAIATVLFGAALVWLRRAPEATIAVAVGAFLGLIAPAAVGWNSDPLRGTVVAAVAAVLCVGVAWTAARRARGPALALSIVSLVAVALVVLERVSAEGTSAGTWLVLLVSAAFISAAGLIRDRGLATSQRGRAIPTGEWIYASVAPPVALAAATITAAGLAGAVLVVVVAMAVLGILHLACAAFERAPLGLVTRVTSGIGLLLIGGAAQFARFDMVVEVVSIPIALVALGGAALAMWRRARAGLDWPAVETYVWCAGLVLALAPSIIAPLEPVRVWLVIVASVLAAIGATVAPVPDASRLKTLSTVLLAGAAWGMGVRALDLPGATGETAALTAAAGTILVAATVVWIGGAERDRWLAPALAALGGTLGLATIFVSGDGELGRTILTLGLATIGALAGAVLLRSKQWRPFGAVLAVGGLVAAALALALRILLGVEVGIRDGGASLEPDAWVLAGAVIAAAVGTVALRSRWAAVAASVGLVWAITIALVVGAEGYLLLAAGATGWRTVLTMIALTIIGVAAAIRRERLGRALPITVAVSGGLFALLALYLGARPFELVTVPPALGLIALGARRLRLDPKSRTWPTIGPWLALLTVPSLMYDFGDSALWRIVALGIVSIALVVIGAVRRLQAPLVLGSVVLLVHAGAQLWPWISAAYVAVPWWLWLGIGGALLILLAARYERQMKALRTAVTAVTSLR